MQALKPPATLRDYGWIASAALLAFLSILPALLMVADSSPLPPEPAADATIALEHDRVVLVMVDGLGYGDAVRSGRMPKLAARMRANASGTALASFPTITPTGLRAIMSGHRMATEPQLPTGMKTWPEMDSVLRRSIAAGLKVHVIAQFSWPPIFPEVKNVHFVDIPYQGPKLKYEYGKPSMIANYDLLALEAAKPIIAGKDGPWDLLVLHLFQVDSIGHAAGKANSIYSEHLSWLDDQLEQLDRRLQDEPTTVLLVADHGQADDGAHGGLTGVERRVPFVLWGAHAKRADLGTRPLYDAAPTLAVLLGVQPPAESEGWPAFDGLRLSERRRALSAVDLARQRLGRWRAFKEINPAIGGDPKGVLKGIQAVCDAKQYADCGRRAEALTRAIDLSMAQAAPDRWLWRHLLALWAVVFACGLGIARSRARTSTALAAAAVALLGALALAAPLVSSSAWPEASALVLAAGVVMLALVIALGSSVGEGLDRYGWLLWWLAMAGMALRGVIPMSAWTWFVVVGLFAGRAMHLTAENKITTILSLLTLLAAAASSVILTPRGWALESAAVCVVLLWAAYFPFVRDSLDGASLWAYAFAVLPVAFSVPIRILAPAAGAWDWAACALSLAAMAVVQPSESQRGIWLSAVCLGYYRSLADDRQWFMLAAAVLVGGLLAWRSRDAHPLWEGLGLIGLGLWSFLLSGGELSFSSITVTEGEKLLGGGWHPIGLAVLLTLKPLAAIGAPIMPRLSSRPLYSVLGIMPLLGALTAGNLSALWWLRFRMGVNMRFADTPPFTQTIFVLILAWGILAMWAAVRGLGTLAERAG